MTQAHKKILLGTLVHSGIQQKTPSFSHVLMYLWGTLHHLPVSCTVWLFFVSHWFHLEEKLNFRIENAGRVVCWVLLKKIQISVSWALILNLSIITWECIQKHAIPALNPSILKGNPRRGTFLGISKNTRGVVFCSCPKGKLSAMKRILIPNPRFPIPSEESPNIEKWNKYKDPGF